MTATAAPASTAARAAAPSKIHRENFDWRDPTQRDAFAQLLQAQPQDGATDGEQNATSDGVDVKQAHADLANPAERTAASGASHDEQLHSVDAATASLADLAGTLLGQTRALDARAETVQLNGQASAQARAHGFGSVSSSVLGQLGTGTSALSLGAGVATVAAGVEMGDIAAERAHIAQATADAASAEQIAQTQAGQRLMAAASLAREGAAAALQASRAVAGDASAWEGTAALDGQGAFTLDATWQAEPADAQAQPTSAQMQRVVAQVAAFAQQWAGNAGRSPQARGAQNAISGEVEGLSAAAAAAMAAGIAAPDAGSGTRTLAQSVAEAAQAQSAQPQPEAAEQPPMQEMRYWLQGPHQRAALHIQHRDADGQLHSVRVQVALAGDQTRVQFASADAATRAALHNHQAELRDMLAGAGLELQALQVAVDDSVSAQAGRSDAGTSQGSAQHFGQAPAGEPPRRARVAAAGGEVSAAPASGRTTASGVDLYA